MKPSTIEAIKVLCDSSNPRSLQGWAWADKALTMARYVEIEKPKVAVTLGVFGGRSTIPTGLQMKDNGFGVIYGIDPWTNQAAVEGEHTAANNQWWGNVDLERVMQRFMGAVVNLGLVDIVIPIRSSSQACSAIFPDESIDILEVDGNHSELASLRDIEHYFPKVRSGGLIWLDDTNAAMWPTNQAAVRKMESLCEKVQVVSCAEGECTLYRKT